jgi:uncharacterized membrane protein
VTQESKTRRYWRLGARTIVGVVALYLLAVYGHFLFNGMPFDPNATTYVTINPADTDRFLTDLSAIAESRGLKPWRGSVTPDDGRTTYIFEASGRALRIWSGNVLLSGNECPDFPGVGSDPGQFAIYASPAIWLPIRSRATTLFEQLSKDLSSKAYSLSSRPSLPCDPARLNGQSSMPPNKTLERTRER